MVCLQTKVMQSEISYISVEASSSTEKSERHHVY